MFKRLFGIREHLESARIPTPTSILTDLLVLKIAQMPTEAGRYLDRNIHIQFPLNGSRTLELSLYWTFAGEPKNNRTEFTLSIGMAGPPKYASVHLEGKEKQRVADALLLLRERNRKQAQVDQEAETQLDALRIIEKLI